MPRSSSHQEATPIDAPQHADEQPMRLEQPREDLIKEATALVERVEFRLDGYSESVVVGFRRGGSASFYFGSERVFQFDAEKQLRRAYIDGQLLKAEQVGLVAVDRAGVPGRVVLKRRTLSLQQTTRILELVAQQLWQLAACLRAKTYSLVRQVPTETDVVGRIGDWLDSFERPIRIAPRPHVGRSSRNR